MKRVLIAVVCVFALGLLPAVCQAQSQKAAPAASGQAENSSTQLTNMANFDMYSLTISPANANQWEENLLAQRTLPNGDVMNLMASKTAKAEAWDLKVTDKEGNSVTWLSLPLNAKGQITLLPDGAYLVKPLKQPAQQTAAQANKAK